MKDHVSLVASLPKKTKQNTQSAVKKKNQKKKKKKRERAKPSTSKVEWQKGIY